MNRPTHLLRWTIYAIRFDRSSFISRPTDCQQIPPSFVAPPLGQEAYRSSSQPSSAPAPGHDRSQKSRRIPSSPPRTPSPSSESGLEYINDSEEGPTQPPVGRVHFGAGATPTPLRSHQPSPPPALHFYRGPFPDQQLALSSRFYQQPISVVVIEDRGLKSTEQTAIDDLWMISSRGYIPPEWLLSVKRQWPDHVFRTTEGLTMVWEWVSRLLCLRSTAICMTHDLLNSLWFSTR